LVVEINKQTLAQVVLALLVVATLAAQVVQVIAFLVIGHKEKKWHILQR
jgi:hypothetical protein